MIRQQGFHDTKVKGIADKLTSALRFEVTAYDEQIRHPARQHAL
jgi:hypothetical protein